MSLALQFTSDFQQNTFAASNRANWGYKRDSHFVTQLSFPSTDINRSKFATLLELG
jgi:hypothetical protein